MLPLGFVILGLSFIGSVIVSNSKKKKIVKCGNKYAAKIYSYVENTSYLLNGAYTMNVIVHYFDKANIEVGYRVSNIHNIVINIYNFFFILSTPILIKLYHEKKRFSSLYNYLFSFFSCFLFSRHGLHLLGSLLKPFSA